MHHILSCSVVLLSVPACIMSSGRSQACQYRGTACIPGASQSGLHAGSVGLPSIVGMERHRAADPMTQAEDVAAIAQLMLTLACAGGSHAVETLASRFSPDLTRVVHASLPQHKGGAGVITTWQQVLLASSASRLQLCAASSRGLGSAS